MTFGVIALWSWPLVALWLFKRYRLPIAVAATIIGGYLLLPTRFGYDLPLLPALNKASIPALCALFLTMLTLSQRRSDYQDIRQASWFPKHPLILGLFLLMFIGVTATSLSNTDTLFYGRTIIPGLRVYDAFSACLNLFIILVPFIIAQRVFSSPQAQKDLLIVLVILAAGYTLLALYEIRMSPQLNAQIYGFFPHSFAQHFRNGGWRPIVFLSHGLWLGIFFACAVIAVAGLWRTEKGPNKKHFFKVLILIGFTLLISKNLTSLVIALLLLGILMFFSLRLQLILSAVIVSSVLLYPTLRYADLVPTERILSIANSVNESRMLSLKTRFDHEDKMLTKAKERQLFGWGGWGRSRVYNEKGDDISTADGRWVIVFGLGGWTRYLAEFGLMAGPVIVLAFQSMRRRVPPQSVILALVLTGNMIDLIPNSGMSPVTWLIAGALAGGLRHRTTESEDSQSLDSAVQTVLAAGEPTRRPAYQASRFAPRPGRNDRYDAKGKAG